LHGTWQRQGAQIYSRREYALCAVDAQHADIPQRMRKFRREERVSCGTGENELRDRVRKRVDTELTLRECQRFRVSALICWS